MNSHSVMDLDGMQLLRHAAIYGIVQIKKNIEQMSHFPSPFNHVHWLTSMIKNLLCFFLIKTHDLSIFLIFSTNSASCSDLF